VANWRRNSLDVCAGRAEEMTDHPTRVANLKPKELAKRVAFMRYDALAEFLGELSAQLYEDAKTDREHGRKVLSARLDAAAHELIHAKQSIEWAWQICEAKMKERK
jgi:monomeric isocitrate dehydrogenase